MHSIAGGKAELQFIIITAHADLESLVDMKGDVKGQDDLEMKLLNVAHIGIWSCAQHNGSTNRRPLLAGMV